MAKHRIAIMYDFDKTLSTHDMQEFEFIPNLGLTASEFWGKTGVVGGKNGMDKILAYMLVMVQECKKNNIKLTKEYLNSLGKSVKFFDGVTTWFDRINAYGLERDCEIEHYIISSGTKEIIEGTSISDKFKEIYACEFVYDDQTLEPIWPKVAINYTNKTQYVFRISKGAFDILDDEKLNTDIQDNERHVMYRNMIYIGDGLTDIPCMQIVKDKGGKSIAVTNNKEVTLKLLQDKRINFVCNANYQEDSALCKYIKQVIDFMVSNEEIQKKESIQNKTRQTLSEKKNV